MQDQQARAAAATSALEDARSAAEARSFTERLAEAKPRPRLTVHGFHRWYGKLIPAIPSAAIEAYSKPGDVVADPFCGSGTVLVESRTAGRTAVGCDVNPLATLLARVKANPPEDGELERAVAETLRRFDEDPAEDWPDRAPAMPNRAHFYPDSVARDLVRLYDAARAETHAPARDFLLATCSAINRDVSNADTRHVFPGVSKRMRAEIEAGWVGDAPARFGRAVSKRRRACAEVASLADGVAPAQVALASAEALPVPAGRAALVVTNPPYMSSIRYVETFKLEAYWLGLVRDRADLQALDRSTLGTERVDGRTPLAAEQIDACPSVAAAAAARGLAARGEHVLCRAVVRYFTGLDAALGRAADALAPGGTAVMKIGSSRLRGVTVPTPEAIVELFAAHGLALAAAASDAYDQRSRSLTTARNWYSGRMDSDDLLVFRKPSP